MRILNSTLGLTGLLALTVAGAQQNAPTTTSVNNPANPTRSVLEIVQDRSNLSTLEAAIGAANLTETLSGDGPFTIFAPTDTAFRVLGEERVRALLDNPDQLAQILAYHVVPGTVTSDLLRNQDMLNTVEGSPIDVTTNPQWIKVNTAYVVTADIQGTNGIVHVIDRVILPSQVQAEQQEQQAPTIVQALGGEQFSTLRNLVQQAGLANELLAADGITVFAPTNEAFAKVPQETLQALASNPELLRSVLLYHVVGRPLSAAQVQGADMLETAQGADLNVTTENNMVMVGGAQVVQPNIQIANGVVHAIGSVLLPPQATAQQQPNAVEALANNEQFSTLLDLVRQAGLADAFAGMDGVTIFAPTNAAFEKVPEETLQALASNPEQLRAVLQYHVVERPLTAAEVQAADTLATSQGAAIDVSMQDGNVLVGGARVVQPNIQVSNGVVHAIDTVLLPPEQAAAGGGTQAAEMPNVVEALSADERFSTLRDLVVQAGLADDLAGMDAVTVFAPTNEAFAKVPQETLQALANDPERLRAVLLYHVVGRELMAADVQAAGSIETAQGANVNVTTENNMVMVGGAQVVEANIDVANGVVHAIDTVLLPPQ